MARPMMAHKSCCTCVNYFISAHIEDITYLGIPSVVEAAVVQSCNQWHVKDADLTRELLKH